MTRTFKLLIILLAATHFSEAQATEIYGWFDQMCKQLIFPTVMLVLAFVTLADMLKIYLEAKKANADVMPYAQIIVPLVRAALFAGFCFTLIAAFAPPIIGYPRFCVPAGFWMPI
jgi:hypothetical protein